MTRRVSEKISDLINSKSRSPTIDEIESVIVAKAQGEPTCPICGVTNATNGDDHGAGCIMRAEQVAWTRCKSRAGGDRAKGSIAVAAVL